MMQSRKWILTSLVMTFFGIPILAQFLAVVIAILGTGLTGIIEVCNILITPTISLLLNVFMLMLGAMVIFLSGRVWARDSSPEKRDIAVWRQSLFLLPAFLTLVGWIIALHLADYQFRQMGSGWLADLMLPWLGVLLVSLVGGEYWWIVIIPVGAHISFSLGYAWPTRHPLTGSHGLCCRNSLLFIVLLLVIVAGYQAHLYKQQNPGVGVRENIDIWAWRPDKLNNRLTPLRGKPQIQFTKNWPRIDGTTAAYPIYASAFYALSVIPEDFHAWNYPANSRTPEAYNKIIKGDADIIFVAQPSGGQKKRAKESGVTLMYTPFAREAFVFIVNADNPVNSLTEQQVCDIFSGAITNWRTVGGNDQEIQTWQRPEDSGSQTVMQSQVMKNVRMISPQETEVASVMEGMIKVIAEYRNTNNSIGYTFRYYATQMNADKNIKLLAINGIAPTVENIRNGNYPYIVDAFMVTRESITSETKKLVEWFLTPQGQQLVQDVGYVPLHPIMNYLKKNIE
ncbi:PstS family phosphate ABC transporter substrate-binding protein [Escherichia coli]|nr:PstS family phosphate ABC transporter substrate-binding protein [Escherichia coli]